MDRASLSLRTLSSPAERDGATARHPDPAAALPQAALEREKARSIAGIRESETQPDAILARRFAAAVFPDHAYGRLPTVDSVASLTRDELVAFHARYYTARARR
jgi:zinc protease